MHRNKSILSVCVLFIFRSWPASSLSSHQQNPIICIILDVCGCVSACFFLFHLMYVYHTKCIHCLRLMISGLLIAVFRLIHSHHFDWFVCVLIYFYTQKARKKNPTVSSLLFVALSGKQKSQHYQINQRPNERTNSACQSNESNTSDCFHHSFDFDCCARKQFYTLFLFNPFVCNQKSLWQLFTMVSSGWSVLTNRDFTVDPFQVM